MSPLEALAAKLAALPCVEQRPSRFGSHEPSWWVRGGELLHFHGDGTVDLRLGRKAIRARRDDLAEDERVRLRPRSSADWVEVAVRSARDVAFVLGLAKIVVGARQDPG